MSKSFCPLPWKQVATSPSGTVRLCCECIHEKGISRNANGDPFQLPGNLEEAWNSSFFQLVRSQMKRGAWPEACTVCRDDEKNGRDSARMRWVKEYGHLRVGSLPLNPQLEGVELLDLRFGNHCNLKCRMCSPYSSSLWIKDWEQLGDLVAPFHDGSRRRLENRWYEDEGTWTEIERIIPGLREIYLTGGEPLLSKGNKRLLLECIRAGRAPSIKLRYSTNGTVWDEEIVSFWKEFREVQLKLSIDGVGAVNEYIRYPSRWNHVLTNLEKYQSVAREARIRLSVDSTIQPYNVFHVPELISFFQGLGLSVFLNKVEAPSFLSISVLPSEIASRAKEALSPVMDYPEVASLVKLLDSSKENFWKKFLRFTEKLDEIRGQSLKAVVPELF